MDAVPVTLGQEAGGWATQVRYGMQRLQACLPRLAELPIGGSAVGSGLNVPEGFGAAVVAELVESGAGAEIARSRRQEVRNRQRLARTLLCVDPANSDPAAPHIWLQLPDPWRREDFARELLNRGVRVSPADAFAVARGDIPHAVRVCICSTERADTLEQGLRTVADLLRDPLATSGAVV
ncbi:MAG TPA: lyase family protein [Azospirillaceae bacterium]|nr:lyase family protein [Azospirillaceae bacterium]